MKKTIKKWKFIAGVDIAKELIMDNLSDTVGCKYKSTSWSTMLIDISTCTVKSVKKIIKDVICSVFECDKASKYCKINVIDNKLYLRFKTA
jgi:hypothetical protein